LRTPCCPIKLPRSYLTCSRRRLSGAHEDGGFHEGARGRARGARAAAAGLLFAGMAVVSLVGVMPAAWVADHLGRKWTIVPSCLGLAAALLLMAATRARPPCRAASRCHRCAGLCTDACDDWALCLDAECRERVHAVVACMPLQPGARCQSHRSAYLSPP